MKRIHLLRVFPFLSPIFKLIFPKILDFTLFPQIKGNVDLIMEERDIYLLYAMNARAANRWNLKIIDVLERKLLSNVKLIRIGSLNDGGYLVPELFTKDQIWFCIGLGYNIEFENDLESRKNLVLSFDHTIENRPKKLNKNVKYFAAGWGSTKESRDKHELHTLNSLFEISGQYPETSALWCLKFDIEGNEWKCLEQINVMKNKPAVIVCELHGALWGSSQYYKENIPVDLAKFLKDYLICSLSGNNFSPFFKNNKYGLYDVFELTLIRKDLVRKLSYTNNRTHALLSKNNKLIEQMPIGRLKD